MDLTHARLLELLAYDAQSGVFRWRGNSSPRVRAGAVAGTLSSYGYVRVKVDGANYMAHRLAWFYVHGCWPLECVDHINGDKADNRIANLRDISLRLNQENQRKAHVNNRTGLLGAHRAGKKFVARIRVNKRAIRLGVFETAQLAHEAYLHAKRAIHAGGTV
jgi:hypothetical protein